MNDAARVSCSDSGIRSDFGVDFGFFWFDLSFFLLRSIVGGEQSVPRIRNMLSSIGQTQ
ncbi:hypothetical protein HanIR_Chr17g0851771 [Helianthus annuus]|nr:hypothetical protein HanIR_Chr17g0851771 [Helianthus annuus]